MMHGRENLWKCLVTLVLSVAINFNPACYHVTRPKPLPPLCFENVSWMFFLWGERRESSSLLYILHELRAFICFSKHSNVNEWILWTQESFCGLRPSAILQSDVTSFPWAASECDRVVLVDLCACGRKIHHFGELKWRTAWMILI